MAYLYVLAKTLGIKEAYDEPARPPSSSSPRYRFYERRSHTSTADYAQYLAAYRKARPGFDPRAPWIGIVFIDPNPSPEPGTVDVVAEALEKAGLNVLPASGYPSEETIEKSFLDAGGKSRVRLVVALGLKMGVRSKVAVPLLEKLGVPVIDAITCYGESYDQWRRSPVGLDLFERGWTVAQPELAGAIQPIVVGTHETVTDPQTGLKFVAEQGIPSRIAMLVQKIKRWLVLQDKPNKDKRVAILYYNYPPGKQGIGASYLNVLPESLWQVLQRLKAEGYDVTGLPATKRELQEAVLAQRNIGPWAPAELDRLAARASVTTIGLPLYAQWSAQLPDAFRQSVLKAWGPPGSSGPMITKSAKGATSFVLPTLRYGNILLTPQASRTGGAATTTLRITIRKRRRITSMWRSTCISATDFGRTPSCTSVRTGRTSGCRARRPGWPTRTRPRP